MAKSPPPNRQNLLNFDDICESLDDVFAVDEYVFFRNQRLTEVLQTLASQPQLDLATEYGPSVKLTIANGQSYPKSHLLEHSQRGFFKCPLTRAIIWIGDIDDLAHDLTTLSLNSLIAKKLSAKNPVRLFASPRPGRKNADNDPVADDVINYQANSGMSGS